jgi:hypothetical protein
MIVDVSRELAFIEVLVESGVGVSCCGTFSIDHTAILIPIAYRIVCYCPCLR